MIYVLLPAYNEANDIACLLKEFTEIKTTNAFQLIVIDDGSTDGTADSVRSHETSLPLTLLIHKTNMGLGKALSTGFTYIADIICDGDILITMDADNSHKPSLINELAVKIYSGFDIVIASRFVKGAIERGVPFTRRVISILGNLLIKTLFPSRDTKDYTSGFRAFSAKTVKRLRRRFGDNIVTQPGFAATLEILLKSLEPGIKVAEVPITLRYDEKTGKSKLNIFETMYQYVLLLMKMRSSR